MKFYANDLFVFEPDQKIFYSHNEFVYQFFKKMIQVPTITISEFCFNKLKQSNDMKDETKKEDKADQNQNIIQDYSFERDLSRIQSIKKETDENLWNQDSAKHNFELYLKIVDLKEYNIELTVDKFIGIYLESIKGELFHFAAYVYLREKGFEIESGSIFGFDFLLYKESKQELGILNKTIRTHSDYAVFIYNEDSSIQYTFLDIQRKHRIAQNYKKKLIVLNIKKTDTDPSKQAIDSIDTILWRFQITDLIYSISKIH